MDDIVEVVDTRAPVKDKRHKKRVKVNSEPEKHNDDKMQDSEPQHYPSHDPTKIEGQLFLIKKTKTGGSNMTSEDANPFWLAVAVDEEHARALSWTQLREKCPLDIHIINMFEPSIRFVQLPHKQMSFPQQERIKPYSVYLSTNHVIYPGNKPGTIIIADGDDNSEQANLLINDFFDEECIPYTDEFDLPFSIHKLDLTEHTLYCI